MEEDHAAEARDLLAAEMKRRERKRGKEEEAELPFEEPEDDDG